MGKVSEKKQQKFEQLLASAQALFMTKGIRETSISDITTHAGIAKGTFYLYFKDKLSIRDCLISRIAQKIFHNAHQALQAESSITEFEDKVIFISDYMIEELSKDKAMLHFISKNLSWGLFRHLYTEDIREENMTGLEIFDKVAAECGVTLKDPEIMMFIIVEMISSTTYSAVLGSDTIPLEKLLPYLNNTIRMIVRSHILKSTPE